MKLEFDIQKRLGKFYIPIWAGCDKSVAAAITMFREQWHSYSQVSKSHNIVRLIKELVDPAVSEYLNSLPTNYLRYSPIAPAKLTYSDLIKMRGFHYCSDCIGDYLRPFVEHSTYTEPDKLFIATQETLKSLFSHCKGKRPKRSRLAPDIYFNTERSKGLCRLCGNPTEFSSFITNWDNDGFIDDTEEKYGLKKGPDFSHKYCAHHKPQLQDGSWNPAYKQAMRSSKQFELEVLRLCRQIAKPERLNAMSGDNLIDEYFYYYLKNKTINYAQSLTCFEHIQNTFSGSITVDEKTCEEIISIVNNMTNAGISLGPDDIDKIRNIAREMVNSRLSDNKKRMLVLRKKGFNQREIAEIISSLIGKKLSHQAVSKAIKSVCDKFQLNYISNKHVYME
ncbi:transcriptional regulator [Providencia sp. PROV039]|uniref:transcriptional regulator n=1 Tax=Providencia sp. PROV039 TaxID=2949770 RepID=UPI00234AF012|nr:transcriptional regulator [Providencia sp. PROV039]